MIRRPPRSTLSSSSAASDVYKRQPITSMNALLYLALPNPDMTMRMAMWSLMMMCQREVCLGCVARCALAGTVCNAVSYTHLRAHETPEHLVCRLLLEKKKKNKQI
eukprot:TRINITY_DN24421_c0_g1_i2.p1 TRINITY_DN24421_c0_g1~~TRINITY_DN24421_c0_g1_i2.p1  ORF type:complete len:106 (+),score=30.35 TRINITY_DN24421_c0_g1_i2:102-419(+)